MPRYTRYLRLEKNIAASDTGGILERWTYGRRLLSDETATTPAGNLKHGVLAALVAAAARAGYKITEREIQYRIQCARAYQTETEIRTACSDFAVWSDLRAAGFPQVEVPDSGDPYDPRDADEKRRDARAELRRRQAEQHPMLFDWAPPESFKGDEHGPRSSVKDLYAACDNSEAYTARMAELDARRRDYVDDLSRAVGGDLDKTWYEAEMRRRGLEAVGLTDWESFDEIMRDFFDLYDAPAPDDDEDDE